MDIQRTILWVVFSLSLLLLWDNWMRYSGHQSMFFPSPAPTQQAEPGAAPANGAAPRADVPQATMPATAAPAAVPGTTAPAASETITITTDRYRAEIDTVGGEIKRLELLGHRDTVDPNRNVVLLDNTAARTYVAQTGLIGGPFPNHRSTFTARPGPRELQNNELQLVMESTQDGVTVVKTYTFHRDSYVIDVRHDVVNNSGAPIAPSVYLQIMRDGNKPAGESALYMTFTGPAIYTEAEKFQKIDFDDVAKGRAKHVTRADDGWVAMVQHYFVTAFVPPEGVTRENFTRRIDNNLYAVGSIIPMGTVEPGATASMDSRLYSGPQESARLVEVAEGLDLVKDYGWLTILARPIFWLMDQIHKVLGNWGWTIIALTVLIKLAFFPLSAASYRSMAKMKTVTPKLQSIRERYKDEPQKMNQAMMELYKTEKINPLGGCLPILVQIPVFIALYWVLLASVEMRNAPWFWINDLSSPDTLFTIPGVNMPIGALPIIMAITMFIQVKLNPTPPDPIQAKVMMAMPIVFSVMFFFFPAGLVLYWVVNNILSIAQQWVITRKIEAGKPA
ncbi:MAG TPA: membrane protein insertase YidC [Noviherbaspirillum sp.]|nr:membrane protein insertase YidC [Noviherbaspirillum sp.]